MENETQTNISQNPNQNQNQQKSYSDDVFEQNIDLADQNSQQAPSFFGNDFDLKEDIFSKDTATADNNAAPATTVDSDPNQILDVSDPSEANVNKLASYDSETFKSINEVSKEEKKEVSSNPKLAIVKHLLEDINKNIEKALELINSEISTEKVEVENEIGDALRNSLQSLSLENPSLASQVVDPTDANAQRIIEGVFDGQNMIGSDGKQYSIPANYASKSKLVEGDILKLTITRQGSFIYKQIGPIERKRVIANLDKDLETNEFFAFLDDKKWKILTASVTYFKGNAGDEIILLVPKDSSSKWAAVENIIKKV